MRRSTRDRYLQGRALFDAGSYFDAHERWEEAWIEESGAARVFLQGLIQIAAALHKASRSEHPGGCVRLFDAGLEKLSAAAGASGVPRLTAFVRSTREARERAAAWQRGESGPPEREDFPAISRRPAGPARTARARRANTRKPHRAGS